MNNKERKMDDLEDITVEDLESIEDLEDREEMETAEPEVIDAKQNKDEITELKEKIAKLEAENKELDNKYYKAYADAQNMSNRSKKDADNLVAYKVSSMVENILPALDNFERALGSEVEDANMKNFLKGFEMIYQQLYSALESEGVERIEAVGQVFDPNLHESIEIIQTSEQDSNIVVEEVQKGYKFRNKVIRPSLVKISE